MREVDGHDALRRPGDDEHVREPEQRDEHEQRLAALAVLLRLGGVCRAQLRDQYLSCNKRESESFISKVGGQGSQVPIDTISIRRPAPLIARNCTTINDGGKAAFDYLPFLAAASPSARVDE